MYADGYKYWLTYRTNTTSYYRCCRYISSKCSGRCISEEGKIRNTTGHNHDPEPDRALVDKFRKILTGRASTEKTELYEIYCDEATSRHPDAAMLYPFTSAESAMRKARRKKFPKIPNTMSDIIDVLDNCDSFRVNSGSDKDPIYQKTITLKDSICMIFMHRKTIELFTCIDQIHIDSSLDFTTSPTSTVYHLLTVHSITHDGYITAPVLYVLLTAKTQLAYTALFKYIKEELNIVPNMITSDFDELMQTTLGLTFPEATIKGNWLHYTDAVLNQMNKFGLQRQTSKGFGASGLRMLLVLPLLPAEYMISGLEALRKWMIEKNIYSESFTNLCNYVENVWLRAIGTEKMSIFGTSRNISNYIKNFNKELVKSIGVQNPIIWIILESITQIATKTYVKVNKRIKIINTAESSGKEKPKQTLATRAQRKNELVTDTIISNATQLWIKTPVHLRSPLQFLQLSSHCVNDTIFLANLTDAKEKITPTNTYLNRSQQNQQKSLHQQEQQQITESIEYQFDYIQEQPLKTNNPKNFMILQQVKSHQREPSFNFENSNQRDKNTFITNNCTNINLSNNQQQSYNQTQMKTISSDPPPLAFFPSVKRLPVKRRLPFLSEPPPLVPICATPLKKIA